MEKSFEEVLLQFYVDQYRENAKRSTGKPVKLAHYIHRLNSKAKSIKYARFSKNETVALDKLHQEIKRLALITYYSNNKNARQILNREIIPQLVRVDMNSCRASHAFPAACAGCGSLSEAFPRYGANSHSPYVAHRWLHASTASQMSAFSRLAIYP